MPNIPVEKLRALMNDPANWLSGEMPMPGKKIIFRSIKDLEKVIPATKPLPIRPPAERNTAEAFDSYLAKLAELLQGKR